MTQTWVDTDGRDVLINTVDGHQKVRNIQRDPPVALNVADPVDPSRYFEVRGRVVELTEVGAREHIDELAALHRPPVPRGSAAAIRSGCWSGSRRRR